MSLSFVRSKIPVLSALLLGLALLVSSAQAQTASMQSSPTASAVPRLDVNQELTALASIQPSFPRLNLKFLEVLGPSTPQYNCIAHSLGLNDRWVFPETRGFRDPFEPWDALYAEIGYVRHDGLNYSVEPGIEKVVLYAALNPDGTIKNMTHAARQAPDGTWTSKLGKMTLIRHMTPDALRGPSYGTPVAVYVRTASPVTQ